MTTLMMPLRRREIRYITPPPTCCFFTVSGFALRPPRPKALGLIRLYAKIEPQDLALQYTLPAASADSHSFEEDFDLSSTLTVLSETTVQDLDARFREDASVYHAEAKQSVVLSIPPIPLWIYFPAVALVFVMVMRSRWLDFIAMLLKLAAYASSAFLVHYSPMPLL